MRLYPRTYCASRCPAGFIDGLHAIFGGRLSTADAVREHHGRDESPYPPMPPDAVVFAHSTEEVAALVSLCSRHRVPLIPYGVGTSLEGHLLALQGGVSVDLSQMNKVLAINPEDLTVTVQAGVTRKQLNQEIRDTGFLLSDRSRRRRDDRRHERDRRVGHQCSALRHDA